MKYTSSVVLLCAAIMTLQVEAACPQFSPVQQTGTIESSLINEVSGITASRRNPSVLWVHNDSGDSAHVYAINTAGKSLGVYSLSGVQAVDWEDIAIGPGPDDTADYLYCGDIGDNNATHSYITVYRLIEPHVDADQSPVTETLTGVDAIRLQYPDGARDAETLMVDPLSGDMYIISKRETPSKVYRAPYPQSTTQINTLQLVAALPWGWATGGDISPTGNLIIVRGYFNASLWNVEDKTQLWQAFAGPPCPIPLAAEPQGEAICFNSDGCGYLTTSEGTSQPIYYFARDTEPLPGNLDGDCDVDLHDFAIFAAAYTDSPAHSIADLDGSGDVNIADLALLAEQWLSGVN